MVGRERELARLSMLVQSAYAGGGGAISVEGPAGVGKTFLVSAAAPSDALWLRGVHAEHDLPYAALNLLVASLRDHEDALPPPQRVALDTVLGVREGAQPGRVILGLAVLGLLAEAAETAPLVVVVDDLQWVDTSSAALFVFAARRLAAESVAIVFTVRTDSGEPSPAAGLPRIELTGLTETAAGNLLPDVHPSVVRTLVERTAGNPLALVEATQALSSEVATGTRALPTDLAVTAPEAVFSQRLGTVDPTARRAARLAALAGDAPRLVLNEALRSSALGLGDLAPAERLGLLAVTDHCVWRHPLARSAAARGTAVESIEAHQALARAWELVSPSHPARAWHLAESATGPDPAAARALARVGEIAERRDASVEAAEAFSRAAQLSSDVATRTTLLERAGVAATRAGASGWAATLLDEALMSQPGPEAAARVLHARARLEHIFGKPEHALELFLQAVDLSTDRELRVWALVEAVLAAMFAGRPDAARRAAELAQHHHDAQDPVHVFLARYATAVSARLNGELAACREMMDEAMSVLWEEQLLETDLRLVTFAVTSELHTDRPTPLRPAEVAALDRLRLAGDLTWLPRVLRLAAMRQAEAGQWTGVPAAFEEAELLSRVSGQQTMLAEVLIALADIDAFTGNREMCVARLEEARQLVATHDLQWQAAWPDFVEGMLLIGEQDLQAALPLLRRSWSSAVPIEPALPEIVAIVRVLESPEAAALELIGLEDHYGPHLTLARAVADPDEMRSSEQIEAEAHQLRHPWQRGRWLLQAGEQLRRAGERRRARVNLREAAELFRAIAATPWLTRAGGRAARIRRHAA